jgi:phosphoglycerate dehydrogenase-like enzyme
MRSMTNAKTLAMTRREAILIDTSHGAIVDIDDLLEVLRSRTIADAAVDVLPVEPPLLHLREDKLRNLVNAPARVASRPAL